MSEFIRIMFVGMIGLIAVIIAAEQLSGRR